MRTIAKKVVGEYAVSVTEMTRVYDGRKVYVVDKTDTMFLRQVALQRFFKKENALNYGRKLVQEMGR